MMCVTNNYSLCFKYGYDRVGPLFQGPYKAVLVENDNQLLHLSRYIHLNPATTKDSPLRITYSSYADYLERKQTPWLKTEPILSFFKTAQKTKLRDMLSYQSFVEDYNHDPKEALEDMILD